MKSLVLPTLCQRGPLHLVPQREHKYPRIKNHSTNFQVPKISEIYSLNSDCTIAEDVPAAMTHQEQIPGLSAALWPSLYDPLIPNVLHFLCLLKHGACVLVFLTVSPCIFGSWQFERNAHAVQGSEHPLEKGQV